MTRLIRNELFKTFRLKKLYAFMAVLVANAWITVHFYGADGEVKSIVTMPNGQSLPLTLIYGMAQFMTVFISVYVADTVAGEFKNGTIKSTLLHPVRRVEWLHAKIASLFVFIAFLVAFSIAAEYAVGTIAFGWGRQTLYAGTLYPPGEGIALTLLLKFSMVLPYLACGIVVVFIGVFAANASATIGLSIGLLTAAQYLNAFEPIKPYSLANQMYFFHESVSRASWDEAVRNTAVMAVYIAVFYGASALILKKKDIVL